MKLQIITDVSLEGVSELLSQEIDGWRRVITYASLTNSFIQFSVVVNFQIVYMQARRICSTTVA